MEKEENAAHRDALRGLAEKVLEGKAEGNYDLSKSSPKDIMALVHELRVHEVELEMQNEELRRIQGEFVNARDKYSHLYDFAPVGYFTFSEKGIIEEANLTSTAMLGAERNVLIGKPFSRFIIGDDQDIFYKHRLRLIETEMPCACELRLVNKGNEFYVRLESMIIKTKGEKVRKIRVAVSNIAEHKKAERDLLNTTHRLKERVKELNCLYEISYLRDRRDITMEEIFQRVADLIPISWQYPEVACSRIRVDDKEYISKNYEETQWVMSENIMVNGNNGGTIEVFYLEQRPPSDIGPFLRWERRLLRAIAERLGNYLEHSAAKAELQKVHENLEQRVEERTNELNKNKVLLQKVFDGFPDPLFLLDGNLKIKLLNKSALKYYQVGIDDALNSFCYHAFKKKSGPCDRCQVPVAIEDRLNMSFERRGLNDPNRLERVTVYQIDKKRARYAGAILRIHDITETKLMERQANHNEKLVTLGLMVSSIAHEIANPVNAVTFNAPILKDYIEAMMPIMDEYAKQTHNFELLQLPYSFFRKDAIDIVKNITHAAERIESTVNDLRGLYSRREERTKNWIDMKTVIDHTIAIVLVEINQPVKSIDVNIPENLPKVFMDADAIEQILTNLLTNAMHAADKENARVNLRVTTGNTWHNHLIIEVSDNGYGMDEETISKIFKPFFTTGETGQRTGLGLFICHYLIQGLGGRIEVQSEVGEGSVFRVVLPDLDRRSINRF